MKLFVVLFSVCVIACQGQKNDVELASTKKKNSDNLTIDQNSRLGGSAFGDDVLNQQNNANATGDNAIGDDITGGQTKKCFIIEHINNTFGFTSAFYKRGDRTVGVYLPIHASMQGWFATPPSDAEARRVLFSTNVIANPKLGNRNLGEKIEATYRTTSDSGPGEIPQQVNHEGKNYVIFTNGEFGSPDCPKKTIEDEGMSSPLIVDLSGSGLSVSSVNDGTYFNLSGTGSEQVAWPYFRKDTPWVVFDSNSDGRISGIEELFGNHTGYDQGFEFSNGFEALAQHDRNKDGVIDRNDSVFDRLLLWRDYNRDGKSEPSELESLARRLQSISLNYIDLIEFDDEHGNMTRQRSTSTTIDGQEAIIYDLWLKTESNKS